MTDKNADDIAYIRKRVDEVHGIASDLRERTAKLEVKAGVWGGIGGLIAGALMYLGLRR